MSHFQGVLGLDYVPSAPISGPLFFVPPTNQYNEPFHSFRQPYPESPQSQPQVEQIEEELSSERPSRVRKQQPSQRVSLRLPLPDPPKESPKPIKLSQQELLHKFSQELDQAINRGGDYDKQCQQLLDQYKALDSDHKKLTKVWYAKILEQEMKEHSKLRSVVADKIMRSPPRQQPDVYPEPPDPTKPARMVKESGFMSRFSHNDNDLNHRARMQEEQKSMLLRQIAEKRQKKAEQKIEDETPWVQPVPEERPQRRAQYVSEFKSDPNSDKFKPVGDEIFRSQIQIGSKHAPIEPSMQQQSYFQRPQMQMHQSQDFQQLQRQMDERLQLDSVMMQQQAKQFMALLQSLVQETVSATQLQHQQLQSLIGLNPQPQVQAIRLPSSLLPDILTPQNHHRMAAPARQSPFRNTRLHPHGLSNEQLDDHFSRQSQKLNSSSLQKQTSIKITPSPQNTEYQKQPSVKISGSGSQQIDNPVLFERQQSGQLIGVQPNSILGFAPSVSSKVINSPKRRQSMTVQQAEPPQHQSPIRKTTLRETSSSPQFLLPSISTHQPNDLIFNGPLEPVTEQPIDFMQPLRRVSSITQLQQFQSHSHSSNPRDINMSHQGQSLIHNLSLNPSPQQIMQNQIQQQSKSPSLVSQQLLVTNNQILPQQQQPSTLNQSSLQQQLIQQPASPQNQSQLQRQPTPQNQSNLVRQQSSQHALIRQPSLNQSLTQPLQSQHHSSQLNESALNRQSPQPPSRSQSMSREIQPYEGHAFSPVNMTDNDPFAPDEPDEPIALVEYRQSARGKPPLPYSKQQSTLKKSDISRQVTNPKSVNFQDSSVQKRTVEIEKSILSIQEKEEVRKITSEQEEAAARLISEIKQLQDEKLNIKLTRERAIQEEMILQKTKQLDLQQSILEKQRLESEAKFKQVQEALLEKAAKEEAYRTRYRYQEDNISLKSEVPREQVVGRPTYQEHDGNPYPPNDGDEFKPIQLATVSVYDPAADVFEQEYLFNKDQDVPAEQETSKVDFDQVMHENFQYEHTMNKQHLHRFNQHTGELMFSRAAMRQFHEHRRQALQLQLYNLAGNGAGHVDQAPVYNKILHDGYVNIGTDMADEQYETYCQQQLREQANIGEVQPWSEVKNDKIFAQGILDMQDRLEAGYIDYSQGKQLYEFDNAFDENINLVDGSGSQHSSFLAKENTQLRQKIGMQQHDQEMHLRILRLAHINGELYQPEHNFVPIAFKPLSRTEQRVMNLSSGDPMSIAPTPSNFIAQAVRQGISDLRSFPTMSSKKEEIINQLFEEARDEVNNESNYFVEQPAETNPIKIIKRISKEPSYKYFKANQVIPDTSLPEEVNLAAQSTSTVRPVPKLAFRNDQAQESGSKSVSEINEQVSKQFSSQQLSTPKQSESLLELHQQLTSGRERLVAKNNPEFKPVFNLKRKRSVVERIKSAISQTSDKLKRSFKLL